ncbi:MAG: NADH-quinone oxidoreductase subunit NuoH [candidate division Zixibacteria bacterium]|nr:NADH-quinone oxidoreductase subunit NuoH [candidate division Zixibacteria bacterium]
MTALIPQSILELDKLVRTIADAIAAVLQGIGLGPAWVTLIQLSIACLVVIAFAAVVVLFLVWWERKISAHIQMRLGPMRVGWHGALQTIADAVKLLQKEDITPTNVDRPIYFWAPILTFVAAVAVYVTIPFGKGLIVSDLNIGILYILSITTFTVIGLLMAGWSSNNKYALLGGFRSAAQVISYEVPMALAIMGVVMFTQTLSMVEIVNQQQSFTHWYIWRQPIGFVVYMIAATAECNRTPFDLPEADSELVAGFVTEYSGMKFAMFFLAEFLNLFSISAIATTLFFGGWQGPFLPSWMWFMIKTLIGVFVLMWVRWTYPRLRVDQLMGFAWRFLLPAAFVNLILTGLLIAVFL